jgi:hypothetical protein
MLAEGRCRKEVGIFIGIEDIKNKYQEPPFPLRIFGKYCMSNPSHRERGGNLFGKTNGSNN